MAATTKKRSPSPLRGARIERHKSHGAPRRVYDIDTPASDLPPREIADRFIASVVTQLRIDLNSLRFDCVKPSIFGSHVLYQQLRDGVPISGAWLRVDISPDGRVFHLMNDLVPVRRTSRRRRTKPHLGARAADAIAREAVEAKTRRVVGHELVQFPVNDVPRPAWKVLVRTERPQGSWKLYIDAANGKVLESHDLVKRVVGRGRVFDPNPISRLNDPTLKPANPAPPQAYFDVDLAGLDGSGFLDGEFVTTKPTDNRVNSATNEFVFDRSQRAFREVMAYYHIDRARRHLSDLGISDVLNRAVPVKVDATKDDLSQYDPPSKTILFGSGGVPDAEDAEIIVHEYGHAIQDDQVPGFGESLEARAMGEGFGDFLSASIFADRKAPALQPMIGTWDASGYAPPQPFLRRVDGKKKYPKDLHNNIYDDGEIWSSCLWQLREQLGSKITELLAIAHHHLLARDATFADAANALLTADKQLNGGAHVTAIRKVFTDRGILRRTKKQGV